jgi:hypothetical protein
MVPAMAPRLTIPLLSLVLLGSVAAARLAAADEEMRTWRDKSGKHQIEATFKEIVDGKVILHQKSGGKMQIDLKKLSPEDQAYVARRNEEAKSSTAATAKDKAASAGDAKSDGSGRKGSSRGGNRPATPIPKTATPDWSGAAVISRAEDSNRWNLTLPSDPADGPQLKPGIVTTPPRIRDESPTSTVVSLSGGHAIVGSEVNERGARHLEEDSYVTRLVLCDLNKRKAIGSGAMPRRFSPLALEEGGMRVLMREQVDGSPDTPLEVWDLTSTGANPLVRWLPHPPRTHTKIKWSAFLNDDRIATIDEKGHLAVWKATTGQLLAQLELGGECHPALTADRKYLIYGAKQEIAAIDLDRLQIVAAMRIESIAWPQLAISPDGTRLACFSGQYLWIWKLADASLELHIPSLSFGVTTKFIWPHEKFLLCGNSELFDIENQITVWRFTGAKEAFRVGPLCAFTVESSGRDPGAIVMVPMPPEVFEKALAKATEAPDFFVMKPGTNVKLNVDGVADPAERERIRVLLAKQLKENGCQVGADGSIELTASIEQKTVQMSYRSMTLIPRTARQVQTYSLQDFTSRVAFNYDGKPIWERSAGSIPYSVTTKPGQSVEAALHESEKPIYDFFQRMKLPKKLMRPTERIGSSWVKYNGIQ